MTTSTLPFDDSHNTEVCVDIVFFKDHSLRTLVVFLFEFLNLESGNLRKLQLCMCSQLNI